ncbi:sortase [Candidatus Saccharibacteria bacterium]|nr:MAG: sortase [Candidatus Saccharibacteria bacterium]
MEIKKKRWKNRLLSLVSILMLLGGVYVLYNVFSPMMTQPNPDNNSTTKLLAETPEESIKENRLYIPKIDINLPYAKGGAGVMERGAWWRSPNSGNPKDGGNFVLSAHRFIMGLTPQQTQRKSPFYNINRLEIGDNIIIDYHKQRYEYKITEVFSVRPEDVKIEKRTEEPRLTLYSCTLGGADDGREVIIAEPVKKSEPKQKSAS